MNWFKWIPVLWKAKTPIEAILKESKTMEDNKPGWKKTEFWITVLTVHIPTIYATVQHLIPADIAAYIHIAAVSGFAIFNTVQKAIENWKTVKKPA